MKRIFTLLLGVVIGLSVFGQRPEAVIKKATVKPVLDGVLDDVWAETDSLSIEKPFTGTVPTLGEPGETWWKALWDEDGFYLFVNVTDNEYFPNYVKGSGDPWNYDKIEVYFDVNYILEDGQAPANSGSGHHQMAPDMAAAKEGGQLNTEGNGRQHAFLVENPNYTAEYFVPWASLTTKDGVQLDYSIPIGFDVTVNDSDPENDTRRRSVWANDGSIVAEAWSNMDECGIITLDGAAIEYVTDVTISVDGAITEDNQKLQVMAEVLPENATVKTVKWIVTTADGGKARATIDADGWITPVVNEELVIQATSSDEFVYSNEVTVSITGQQPTHSELSYIKNGDFNVFNAETLAPGAPWTGGSTVVDGVLNITNTNGQGVNPWDWTVGQDVKIPEELKNDPFVLTIKLWMAEPDTFDVDFELIGDNYLRFGNTTDPRSADGRSQWRFELTTEPTTYTIDITDFSGMDTRTQKFNLFAGLSGSTVYVDSVFLVSVADMDLIGTAISQKKALESFKVYPNPASSKLNVELSSVNSTVAIYNSVGIKMDEVVVFGTRHTFDVSSYAKGLYFVKANGAVVKFVK